MVAGDDPVELARMPFTALRPTAPCGRCSDPDVAIDIEAIDETNTRIDIEALLARFERNGGFGLVALIGVQSNQYPRALDIARPFREAGIAVAIGGFHVSGCLSMLDGHAVDLDACRGHGHLHIRGRSGGPARDAAASMRPRASSRRVYNFMKDLPGMEGTPVPFLPKRYVVRTLGQSTSFDAGRGCPYQCSFCTIINVQGRKSRYRIAGRRRAFGAPELRRKTFTSSSSPTTISRATRSGKRSSTG